MAPLREIVSHLAKPSPKTQVAAAVAVRPRASGGSEFLLVRTHSGERWTFPKGHRDRAETLAEAAAREALEEAGVRGRVELEPFAHYRYVNAKGRDDLVTAFRLSVEREGLPTEPHRDPGWFGLESARSRLAVGRDGGVGEEMERVLLAAQECDRDGFAVT